TPRAFAPSPPPLSPAKPWERGEPSSAARQSRDIWGHFGRRLPTRTNTLGNLRTTHPTHGLATDRDGSKVAKLTHIHLAIFAETAPGPVYLSPLIHARR